MTRVYSPPPRNKQKYPSARALHPPRTRAGQSLLLAVFMTVGLLLCGTVVIVSTIVTDTSAGPANGAAPQDTPTNTPTPATAPPVEVMPTLADPSPTPTPQPTAPPAPEKTLPPTGTATQSPTPSPTPTPPEHYWLARPIGSQNQDYMNPTYLYGTYGDGSLYLHRGVDFDGNSVGTPVLAAGAGAVIVAGTDSKIAYGLELNFYGNLIVVESNRLWHGQSVYALYAHLSRMSVRVGDSVREGQVIGAVGEEGQAIGPHLHFEVRVGNNDYASTRNPALWIKPYPGTGNIAGRLVDARGQMIPRANIVIRRTGAPNTPYRDVDTYPNRSVNADDDWQENFVMPQVEPGRMLVQTIVYGRLYSQEVVVVEGQTTFVVLKAE